MRRLLGAVVVASMFAFAGTAQAAEPDSVVSYGPEATDTAAVYLAGRVPVLLLHEKGQTWTMVRGQASSLQNAGFTVFDLEWSATHHGIFPYETNQIEGAIAFVRAHAAAYRVDPERLAVVSASRGALLALLATERANAKAPGTVKALVALSGQPNSEAAIERARRGELAKVMVGNLADAFGCDKELAWCPEEYVYEWSAINKASARSPAMFLAASEAERRAWVADQYEMAAKLERLGVAAQVVVPPEGHGYGYWGQVRDAVFGFLREHV
jgi:dipeptidyl aminopeptidase/acylaminoacyl peptidase